MCKLSKKYAVYIHNDFLHPHLLLDSIINSNFKFLKRPGKEKESVVLSCAYMIFNFNRFTRLNPLGRHLVNVLVNSARVKLKIMYAHGSTTLSFSARYKLCYYIIYK